MLDCDAVYHELLQTDPELLCAIEAAFPGTVKDGCLDRRSLGSRVFSDPEALLRLNHITHGAVKNEVLRRLACKPALAAIDAIALFEGGLAPLCDVTVAVTAPLEARVERLTNRDDISPEYARARIAAQKPQSFFEERCTHVLRNDGTREQFRQACRALLWQILG